MIVVSIVLFERFVQKFIDVAWTWFAEKFDALIDRNNGSAWIESIIDSHVMMFVVFD